MFKPNKTSQKRNTPSSTLQLAQQKLFRDSGNASRAYQNIRDLIRAYPNSSLAHSTVLESLHQLAEDIVLQYEDTKETILKARNTK